ncbi:MAG: aminotransferase class V-fold PLP-dependent enzyme [Ardenticatenales bacterium]|nr:aminotransferase class V-fold PLP-dependent enzyme [Ardenticatenales bacterium]
MTIPHDDLLRYRAEFPILSKKVYLNSCSLGALSTRTRAAVNGFMDDWENWGASAWYRDWIGVLADTRREFAMLIGAGEHEIALLPSVSAALGALASGMSSTFTERPEVITTDLDFPTVHYLWQAWHREGVELTVLPGNGVTVPLEQWEASLSPRTALAMTSHVFFTSGAIQDVQVLTEMAHAQGALSVIDAYQGTGQLPTDVKALGVDVLMTGGLKWLLGGPGIVYLYVREGLIPRFEPLLTGWFANQHQFAFDPNRFEYSSDARRFESGTPPLASVFAGRAGLQILNEIGPQRIRERTSALLYDFIDRARARGWDIRGASMEPEQRAGIALMNVADPTGLTAALKERNIILDYRPGAIRYSTYFYNTVEENTMLLEALDELLR